jgi:hypothetical protein
MAKKKSLLPLLAAGGALILVLLGKKKKDEGENGGLEATPATPGRPPATPAEPTPPKPPGPGDIKGQLPPSVPSPKGWYDRFDPAYEQATRDCFAELGPIDSAEIKACVLRKLFPEAVWPPLKNAHQWQRQLWYHGVWNQFVLDQYPPVT